jgi:hypothetical protein
MDEATMVGFGPDATMKFTTTYFRGTFTVANVATIKTVVLQMIADDGAVVYLNGEEVWRYNMPAGAIDSKTFATMSIGGAAETRVNQDLSVLPAKLKEGANTIAVEIHQSDLTSSDLSFDFGVQVERTGAPTDAGASDARDATAVLEGGTPDAISAPDAAGDAAPADAAAPDAAVAADAADLDAIPGSDAAADAASDSAADSATD